MPAFAYVIRHDPTCDGACAWQLELDGRLLAHFGSLVAALDSAKSLHDIDGRGGFSSTVDVLMSYGRFRVRWLDGQRDAICITDVSQDHPEESPRRRGTPDRPRAAQGSR